MIQFITRSLLALFGLAYYSEIQSLKAELARARNGFEKRFINVTLLYEGIKATEIKESDLLLIPTGKYLQVAPGVYDRALTGPNDIKFDFEKPYKEKIQKMDFDNCHVIFVRFIDNGRFSKHYHKTDEIIHYLEGIVRGGLNGTIFKAGDKQVIPAMTIHVFHPLSDGYALIELYKPK